MKETKKDIFDKLDKKVLKEMPVLISSLAATHNKIARLLDPMHEDLKEVLEKRVSTHKYWKIQKDQKIFHPLAYVEYSNTTKIEQLENYCDLNYEFDIRKIVKSKIKNHIFIQFGYWYEKNDEEDKNCLYFQIFKWDSYEKYGGLLADLKYYEKIKSNINGVDYIEIQHPENGEESETFYIQCNEFNSVRITKTYNEFKTKVVLPTVDKLLKQ